MKDNKREIFFLICILSFCLLILVYEFYFSCGLEFKQYDDGWYRIDEKHSVDTHTGNNLSKYVKTNNGPYTQKQVDKMLEDCKLIQKK